MAAHDGNTGSPEKTGKDGRPLPEKIIEAHRQSGAPLTRDDVASIVSSVIGTMDGDLRATNVKL